MSPRSLSLEHGVAVNFDGVDDKARVLCEIYARIGPLKGSQPHKVAGDILKLFLAERSLGGNWRKIVCFADPVAAKLLAGRSWLAYAVREFGVRVEVIEISAELRESIAAAQKRQIMVNRP
jgi:hypothetical protein